MQSDLRILLDKVYELEGLVHLALKRNEAAEDLKRLIAAKGKEVEELCKGFEEVPVEKENADTLSDQSFLLEEYAIEDDREIKKPLQSATPSAEKQKTSEPRNGKPVFSINDKFRFKKALFDNSDVDFNNTLALVASMEDYEEAEDYFLNEEGFDRHNAVVKEFLAVVKKYFS